MRTLEEYKEAIAVNIRGYRDGLGYTQQQLADLSGLARTHISALEQGVGNPSLVSLHDIASALGVDIELLLKDSENTRG